MPAQSFVIGRYWSRTLEPPNCRSNRAWAEAPDVMQWLDETEFGGVHEILFDVGDSEYDTGLIEFLIVVAYEDPDDAFLHRMRW